MFVLLINDYFKLDHHLSKSIKMAIMTKSGYLDYNMLIP